MKNKNFYMIGCLQIPQRELLMASLWYFDHNNQEEGSVRSIFKKLKELTGYGFDNDHLFWSNIYGHHFSISIHFEDNKRTNKQSWEIHLWDHTGTKTLICLNQDCVDKETDILSLENYRKLCEVSENFVHGKINCSDCGKEINFSEIAGRYFAGQYCVNCWNGKWKAIEAKETYN